MSEAAGRRAAADGCAAGASAGCLAGAADVWLVLEGTGAWWVSAVDVLACVAVYAAGGAMAGAALGAALGRLPRMRAPGSPFRVVLATAALVVALALGAYHLYDVGLGPGRRGHPLPYALLFVLGIAGAAALWWLAGRFPRPRAWLVLCALAALAAGFGLRFATAREEARVFASRGGDAAAPNVVLLVMDTTRLDALSLYGNARSTTPVLDRIGAEGVVFQRCYSAAPWTPPSHATIFTGLYPSAHGTYGHRVRLLPDRSVLSELFAGAGYDTFFVSGKGMLNRDDGWMRGFGVGVALDIDDRSAPVFTNLWRQLRVPKFKTPVLIDMALRLMSRSTDNGNPFFLFLNLDDPHTPYEEMQPWFSEYARDIDLSRVDLDKIHYLVRTDYRLYEVVLGETALNDEELRYMRAMYDSQTAFMDRQVGRLLEHMEALRESGRPSVLLVTADHGEMFGEHGLMSHTTFLYEELIHVPLLLWGSGIPAGRVVDGVVSHVDILPTLAELSGLELGDPSGFPGRTLLGTGRSDAVFAEAWTKPKHIGLQLLGGLATKAMIGADEKLVWDHPDRWRMYDLASDPGELSDRAADRPATVEAWRAELSARFDVENAVRGLEAIDEDTIDKLRDLGYL